MNPLDGIALVLLSVCMLIGLLGGLLGALTTIVAWGGALWLTLYFAPKALHMLHSFETLGEAAIPIAVLGGFAAWLILLLLVLRLCLSLLNASAAGGNKGHRRQGGLAAGFLSGLWCCLVLIFLGEFTALAETRQWRDSLVQQSLQEPGAYLWRVLPPDPRDHDATPRDGS